MGEMADFLNDQIMDTLEASDLDGWEQEEEGPFPEPTKTCRCCGKEGLKWGFEYGKWRLFDRGVIHKCPKNPLKS